MNNPTITQTTVELTELTKRQLPILSQITQGAGSVLGDATSFVGQQVTQIAGTVEQGIEAVKNEVQVIGNEVQVIGNEVKFISNLFSYGIPIILALIILCCIPKFFKFAS